MHNDKTTPTATSADLPFAENVYGLTCDLAYFLNPMAPAQRYCNLITLCLFALFMSGTIDGFSQTLDGHVYNLRKQAVEDVALLNISTGEHAHTNASGHFHLPYRSSSDTVILRHIAYRTDTIYLMDLDLRVSAEIFLVEQSFLLDSISITRKVNSLSITSDIDLAVNPVLSAQEILPVVPGLFIGQHAGGGKAEQIFMRGFDVDHGTDVLITAGGLPANMVSHAHGQGYADLHFIIPEAVESVDYGKGPYYADKGNFCTAGYVDMQLKRKLNQSTVAIEGGSFNTLRTSALIGFGAEDGSSDSYVGFEYLLTDGWFDSPQNFKRINLLGRHTTEIKKGELSILASHFSSNWDASGQIPWRAVNSGEISRFGAIDDTEGGTTSRTNIGVQSKHFVANDLILRNNAYFSHYTFELYSNFTFFLRDSINGDQIRQKEARNTYGFESRLEHESNWIGTGTLLYGALGMRYDDSKDNELSYTANRQELLENVQLGDVNETNFYGYAGIDIEFGDWLLNPALRVDYFKFDYHDQLSVNYSRESQSKFIASPKLNILYQPTNKIQYYLKTGIGFHSNDSRVVIAQEGTNILPKAYGTDLGFIWKPIPKLVVNSALWYLFLEQEFVYVGDEGIVEPSGETQRIGVDIGLRYQIRDNLFLFTDLNYAHARSLNVPENEDFIPLAPVFTSTGGITYSHRSGFSGGLNYRLMGERPANEDNSIRAAGYFITDFNLNYTLGKWTFGITIDNILDSEWEETQFATTSQLRNESEPVEEIHFTPGTPRAVRFGVRFGF